MTDAAVLDRNLRALQRTSPAAAAQIRAAEPSAQCAFEPAADGALAVSLGGRWLTSRRAPLVEAERLARAVDVARAGVVVVLGFGAGHHLAKLAEQIGRRGLLVCFEPDVALLRAVLERVDVTGPLSQANVLLLTEPGNSAPLTSGLAGAEALVAMGVRIVEHPPSRQRLASATPRFLEMFTEVTRAVRTTLVTTLVQSPRTLSNELGNLGVYVSSPGVAEMAQSLAQRPSIVVSAGPSLQRNIHLLAQEGVRDRFLIIAVQTTLKPLLAAGVVPHFVTALDYSDISARFYEGLTADDVAGATLVVEPKASPAICRAWPGPVRMPRSDFLDAMLGVALAGDHGELRPGATVAHLAYYLARHLGCDPVIFIGQDLGFTDGQYYAAGAAIHNVWAAELNPLRSLEMFEHERIVRARRMLRRATDTLGRPVWTDEQMEAYRLQFERDFAADAQRGLQIIDATEGGVRKAGAQVMTLAEAIESLGAGPLDLPPLPEVAGRDDLPRQAAERARVIAKQTRDLAEASRQTLSHLEKMPQQRDQRRLNHLIEQARKAGEKARAIQPAFGLVHLLNQTGALKRVQADRAIETETLDPKQRQQRRIQRDITNVQWTADAADELAAMLACAADAVDSGAPAPAAPPLETAAAEPTPVTPGTPPHCRPAAAVIFVDDAVGGLGQERDLREPIAGASPLVWTLRRLSACRLIDRVLIASADVAAARALANSAPTGLSLEFIGVALDRARRRAIGAARRLSSACWRGGLAGLTVYDEAFDPAALDDVMARLDLPEAVIVGADWALVDPETIDDLVRRQREDEDRRTLVFSQAPPGLGAVLVTRKVACDLAASLPGAGPFSTIGALIGYLPSAPRPDPIATGMCVTPEPQVRDLGARFICDAPAGRRMVEDLLGQYGEAGRAPAAALRAAAEKATGKRSPRQPQRLTLELCTGRLTSGARAAWLFDHEPPERPAMTLDLAAAAIEQFAQIAPAGAVTLAGAGDPLQSPIVVDVIRLAKRAGLCAHVRTDLLCEPDRAAALVEAGADIISVDLLAHDAATYRMLAGVDAYDRVRANIESLIDTRVRAGGVPIPWIVPRITRCDAVYEQIEPFYDHWLLRAGSAVIDPLPREMAGERIAPLPLPEHSARRLMAEEVTVLSDGALLAGAGPLAAARARPMGSVLRDTISELSTARRRKQVARA